MLFVAFFKEKTNLFIIDAHCFFSSEITNGTCSSDSECLYTNAVCVSSQCTCPSDRFVNTAAQSCDLSKYDFLLLVPQCEFEIILNS